MGPLGTRNLLPAFRFAATALARVSNGGGGDEFTSHVHDGPVAEAMDYTHDVNPFGLAGQLADNLW